MSIARLRSRLTRAIVFIILAALVALLGAAAKHSQFDASPHSGYLSKAVKMAGTRVQTVTGALLCPSISSPAPDKPLLAGTQSIVPAPLFARFTPVSLSSPPLRA